MEYAIQLAQMVKGQTGINPPVGAVVVNNGRIVGLGAHLKQGEKHAEVQALDMAGKEAKGGIIYISARTMYPLWLNTTICEQNY